MRIDKRWILAVDIVGALKQQGWRRYSLPAEALKRMAAKSLARPPGVPDYEVAKRVFVEPGIHGLLKAVENMEEIDVVNLR